MHFSSARLQFIRLQYADSAFYGYIFIPILSSVIFFLYHFYLKHFFNSNTSLYKLCFNFER